MMRERQNLVVDGETTKRTPTEKKSGSTLIEATVALGLFAVFIGGACKLFLSHQQLTEASRSRYQAINLAKNRLELVRSFDFNQRAAFLEDHVVVDSKGVPNRSGHYRRSTSATMISSNIIELAVTVQVKDRVSMEFDGAEETIKGYFTIHHERP